MVHQRGGEGLGRSGQSSPKCVVTFLNPSLPSRSRNSIREAYKSDTEQGEKQTLQRSSRLLVCGDLSWSEGLRHYEFEFNVKIKSTEFMHFNINLLKLFVDNATIIFLVKMLCISLNPPGPEYRLSTGRRVGRWEGGGKGGSPLGHWDSLRLVSMGHSERLQLGVTFLLIP